MISFLLPPRPSFLLFPPYLPSVLFFLLDFFLSPCCRRDTVCCYSTLNTSPNTWATAASHLPSLSRPQWGLRQPPELGLTGKEGFRVLRAAQASHFTLVLILDLTLASHLECYSDKPRFGGFWGGVLFVFKISWEYFSWRLSFLSPMFRENMEKAFPQKENKVQSLTQSIHYVMFLTNF